MRRRDLVKAVAASPLLWSGHGTPRSIAQTQTDKPQYGGTLTAALQNDAKSLDPTFQINFSERQPLYLIFNTLVGLAPDFTIPARTGRALGNHREWTAVDLPLAQRCDVPRRHPFQRRGGEMESRPAHGREGEFAVAPTADGVDRRCRGARRQHPAVAAKRSGSGSAWDAGAARRLHDLAAVGGQIRRGHWPQSRWHRPVRLQGMDSRLAHRRREELELLGKRQALSRPDRLHPDFQLGRRHFAAANARTGFRRRAVASGHPPGGDADGTYPDPEPRRAVDGIADAGRSAPFQQSQTAAGDGPRHRPPAHRQQSSWTARRR